MYAEDSKLPSKENIDELRVRVSQSCKIELNDVLHAHNKDSRFLDRKFILSYDIIVPFSLYTIVALDIFNIFTDHCPNFALLIIHSHRQVVLNICGTEVTSLQDILMDLCGDSYPFLQGRAHKAMLQGAKKIIYGEMIDDKSFNILDKIITGSSK